MNNLFQKVVSTFTGSTTGENQSKATEIECNSRITYHKIDPNSTFQHYLNELDQNVPPTSRDDRGISRSHVYTDNLISVNRIDRDGQINIGMPYSVQTDSMKESTQNSIYVSSYPDSDGNHRSKEESIDNMMKTGIFQFEHDSITVENGAVKDQIRAKFLEIALDEGLVNEFADNVRSRLNSSYSPVVVRNNVMYSRE
ncbi:uncharacterized protein L201_007500 [Kwoniella dendrophila CBS 6074]|uniref:Uncharacterized protein n=1 Tax=Kwoniella dendrophila CBS 6074 TaxID=1295534 RepID=A0AAX4K4K0_9TREE